MIEQYKTMIIFVDNKSSQECVMVVHWEIGQGHLVSRHSVPDPDSELMVRNSVTTNQGAGHQMQRGGQRSRRRASGCTLIQPSENVLF